MIAALPEASSLLQSSDAFTVFSELMTRQGENVSTPKMSANGTILLAKVVGCLETSQAIVGKRQKVRGVGVSWIDGVQAGSEEVGIFW